MPRQRPATIWDLRRMKSVVDTLAGVDNADTRCEIWLAYAEAWGVNIDPCLKLAGIEYEMCLLRKIAKHAQDHAHKEMTDHDQS